MRKTVVNGAKLMVVDDLPPEDGAMLQALYSRSAESAETHLEKVRASGSGKFMSSFYVGYGHKSIADCGSTTMFIENVSLLAAKAIQDWPLYSGQETSTRYIDMSKQRIVDPVGTMASALVLRAWTDFYTKSQTAVAEYVRARYPRKEDEKEDVYERAVKARVFDVLRGFLPAGICTQLSWHTNIRQAGDHLVWLTKHPVGEVRDIAFSLRKLLGEQYPSSGAGLNLASMSGESNRDRQAAEARERWEAEASLGLTYFTSDDDETELRMQTTVPPLTGLYVRDRPRGSVLPHSMSALGQIRFAFGLDFGSFRDLQRHRNGVVRMPLLTMKHGFEEWYLKELGSREEEGRALVASQRKEIENLTGNAYDRQFYIPLGFIVPAHVTWGLPAAVYVMELRSGKHVHPTLRARVHQMVRAFKREYPQVALHVDMDADDWTVRRGQQTITVKS